MSGTLVSLILINSIVCKLPACLLASAAASITETARVQGIRVQAANHLRLARHGRLPCGAGIISKVRPCDRSPSPSDLPHAGGPGEARGLSRSPGRHVCWPRPPSAKASSPAFSRICTPHTALSLMLRCCSRGDKLGMVAFVPSSVCWAGNTPL